MIAALIITGSVIAYFSGWLFAAMCFKQDDDLMGVMVAALLGLFPIPIAFWYGYCRPSKHQRAALLAHTIHEQARAIERMAAAVNSIPADKWQVVRAEHLDQIVEKLSKKSSDAGN